MSGFSDSVELEQLQIARAMAQLEFEREQREREESDLRRALLRRQLAELKGTKNSNESSPVLPGDLVTLLQMSAIVQRSKKTMQRLYSQGTLPAPASTGGKGKPHQWQWAVVRPILEHEYNRRLPETFPTDKFVRSL